MRTITLAVAAVAVTVALAGPAYAETPTPTPTATPTATATPKVTVVQQVTASYGCGTATFSNPLDTPVLIIYGTAQSDDVEGRLTLAAGTSKTVASTNTQFGWTAWANGDQTQDDVGHEWAPGKDLTCDDTTVTPAATPEDASQGEIDARRDGGGLASTGN